MIGARRTAPEAVRWTRPLKPAAASRRRSVRKPALAKSQAGDLTLHVDQLVEFFIAAGKKGSRSTDNTKASGNEPGPALGDPRWI